MVNTQNIEEIAQKLQIIQALINSPLPISHFNNLQNVVSSLIEHKLVTQKDEQLYLSSFGKKLWKYLQDDYTALLMNPSENSIDIKKPSKIELQRQKKLDKSNEYLELYKIGFSYQQIGDHYKVTRERVRQVLNSNPAFKEYLEEREQEKTIVEEKKQEQAKAELYARSLAALYPKQVAELWDYEKNGDLNPEEIPAGTVTQYVWFKCPIDGHSWKKNPYSITISWVRSETSGCPVCAGKTKKAEKQPKLIEVYPELVEQYWNYEKNQELGIEPDKTTLGSNKKAWFKCQIDGNEWEGTIAIIINQQWSKGNPGCRVCNGTDERKIGEWKRRDALVVEFPEEVTKYWHYDKNNELKLDPMKLTIGSNKDAWFKFPIDGYEWQAKITLLAKVSWKKGNSGCPACRGLIATESTSLVALYPDYIAQYWDYHKNDILGLNPHQLTRGSTQEAWFKCSYDGYEWKTRIGTITRCSWNLGNNGCARCGSGWTIEAIRQFVASLEEHIPNLTPAERYKIFEQAGVLGTQNSAGLKIIKDVIKGKLSGTKLKSFLQDKEVTKSDPKIEYNEVINADKELSVIDNITNSNSLDINTAFDTLDQFYNSENSNKLPKHRVQKSLEFLNSQVVTSADQEAIEFFIASRRNRIWADVFQDESAVEAVEEFTNEGYGRQVRDQFLDEYYQAKNIAIPAGWGFRKDGKITPPNLMQKLAAVRLRSQKRMLNLSLTGTGKTIGGILSSRIIDANLTIIICPRDTVSNWHSEIKQVFPDSKVTERRFNPYWDDVNNGHHYIILNHELFQQHSTPTQIGQLLERYKIDLIIIDEIHRCKQRGDDISKRRQMVMALITNAAEKNPEVHVLGMSATPVINNLKEGKSLVELVTGEKYLDLGEKATLNNCMKLYQAFVTLGIRSRVKPNIYVPPIKKIPIDCTHLVDELREHGTSILKMEQILTRARIPTIIKELHPKTIIYTHYVEGIVDQLKEAIEATGLTVDFHIGGNKSGFHSFINGSTDILIAR
ncbi:zinc-ribbon domain-containing protein, partial [Anabaena sp. UHCC 0451]|uniref:zinc-ribbon domain-containing protein n=1 Tax=Anabaena sp. UHCC 0451 TaxID=2055235 RepID=UPI002B21659F